MTARLFFPSACAEQAVVEAAGAAAEGAYFGSAYLPFDDPSPEVRGVAVTDEADASSPRPGSAW